MGIGGKMKLESPLAGKTFDPRKGWYSQRTFILEPGSKPEALADGRKKLLQMLELEMITFIPVKFRRRVRFYWSDPKPPKQGVVGWRYTP
jgi:hypothetical protein